MPPTASVLDVFCTAGRTTAESWTAEVRWEIGERSGKGWVWRLILGKNIQQRQQNTA